MQWGGHFSDQLQFLSHFHHETCVYSGPLRRFRIWVNERDSPTHFWCSSWFIICKGVPGPPFPILSLDSSPNPKRSRIRTVLFPSSSLRAIYGKERIRQWPSEWGHCEKHDWNRRRSPCERLPAWISCPPSNSTPTTIEIVSFFWAGEKRFLRVAIVRNSWGAIGNPREIDHRRTASLPPSPSSSPLKPFFAHLTWSLPWRKNGLRLWSSVSAEKEQRTRKEGRSSLWTTTYKSQEQQWLFAGEEKESALRTS